MKSNSQIRSSALASLKNNWGMAIVAFIIYGFFYSLINPDATHTIYENIQDNTTYQIYYNPIYSFAFLLIGPLELGYHKLYLDFDNTGKFNLETLFSGFKKFVPALFLFILQGLFVFLWTLLLIIPGIIKAISYSQAYFIMAEHEDLSAMDAIDKSMEMMEGHKMQYFVLMFVFFLMMVFSVILLFIPLFFIYPWMKMSLTKFYQEIKLESQMIYN
jgi:uncharacterized membrane protein